MSEPTNDELVALHEAARGLVDQIALLGMETIEIPINGTDYVVTVAPAAWQPAASPPPFLTMVLLHFPSGAQRIGQWSETTGAYHPPRLDRRFLDAPTHWRPLPAGPR